MSRKAKTGIAVVDGAADGEQWLVRCLALERLEHGSELIEPGTVVLLDAATAGALLLAGRVLMVGGDG